MKWPTSLTMFVVALGMTIYPVTAIAQSEDEAWWEDSSYYNEDEWYDPTDWFDGNNYEYAYDEYDGLYDNEYGYDYDHDWNDNEYGYDYDDGWDYGWDYDSYADDWEYGWHYDDGYDYDYDYDYNDADYEFNRQAKGTIVGLERLRGAQGAPESVRVKLRTDDGRTRTLLLGDIAYVDENLPRLHKGDRIVIGGDTANVNGKKIFRAKEIRGKTGSYKIPDYEYERRIEGRLTGLRKVRLNNGNVEAVVAKVEPYEGRTMNVLLGRTEDLERQGQSLRPGDRVRVEGYTREIDGKTTFVVQDVRFQNQDRNRQQGQQRDQQKTESGQQQPSDQQARREGRPQR